MDEAHLTTNTCLGYAARLKPYPHKGVTGLPERLDSPAVLSRKLKRLVAMVTEAASNNGRVVALTGAGISTAAGIPDFRGPRGIWTLEDERAKQEKKKKREAGKYGRGRGGEGSSAARRGRDEDGASERRNDALLPSTTPKRRRKGTTTATTGDNTMQTPSSSGVPEEEERREAATTSVAAGASFEAARPTPTHRALAALARSGRLAWCATQNVDGLDLRSGFPRDKLAVLHGCVFTERCAACGDEVARDRDVGGVGLQPTGQTCVRCGGQLRDTVLDWDDAIADRDWEPTQRAFDDADLALCLGTSLRITPAADLPLTAKRFVVVNLQPTPHDAQAALVVRARVDDVMRHLLDALGLDLDVDRPEHTLDSGLSSP
mmetsp:Transcript_18543/g.74032  ORF Transcript_18543/g.74032 Transcript_18543/m.74032 type:complete len:376 (-) Transcript_18543:493-1620(-)|eukprot:CAMPEP_0185718346 /NCGR_PEP_ID=MMETSP1164-20130828/46591_1 /TAXON_ID=1104430 /ORGANISM="Chrysoreinhardia sp, Strain CCMP2950" /LENGTH=375 /DNA_ID=CAMNT_0028385987 /DNA_START=423 /DNA_END=1550 /DNA_ORIENTATION=+